MDPINKDSNTQASSSSQPTAPVATNPVSTPQMPPQNTVVTPGADTPPIQTGRVEKSNSNVLIYLFIGVLIVILLGLMGLFFYNRLSAATSAESKIVVPTTEPKATPTVVIPTYSSAEEKEVMGVEVGAVDSQLNIIENDMNKL